jgi:DNA-binding response OmpR family regulator
MMTQPGIERPAGERILVVDDEPDIVALVAYHLAKSGYRVSTASSGADAADLARRERPALVVLDLMLPDLSGFDVLERLRADDATRDVAVLMLTARREEPDRIRGLSLGADDYLAKPFNPRELLARARNVLRRWEMAPRKATTDEVSRYRFAGWTLDTAARELIDPDGARQTLTGAEYRLLLAFVSHPNRVLSRHQLIELTRTRRAELFDRSIDVRVSRLRQLLRDQSRTPHIIKTVYGDGYVLGATVEVE